MRLASTSFLVHGLLPLALLLAGCGGDDSTSNYPHKPKVDAGTGGSGGAMLDGGGMGGSGGTQMNTDGGSTACTGDCKTNKTGAGTEDPFDPETNESGNVSLDQDGALVLDRSASQSPHVIWIANSGQSTVSKVDTTTFQELGRYRTGAGDPSRTSVNSIGDVYVGNRGGHSLTKISAAGDKCPDSNGDGVVTTSHSAAEILTYGQDDCVLWETQLEGYIRGVAADDKYTQVQVDPDLPPQIEEEHYVWVGNLPGGTLWKLDGATGAVLLKTQGPCGGIYGLALDGKGNLWSATNDGCVGRIDTLKCKDNASCAAEPVCQTTCDGTGNCGDQCDGAMMQRIAMPEGTYGITVDFKQRVWLGGGSGIKRYDPKLPAAQRYAHSGANGFSHGIAADANGWVWGANDPNVVRVNGDTLEWTKINVGSSKGMAVDKDGKIWAISYMKDFASVITPGPTIDQNPVQQPVQGLASPYTYSDMTGLQAALAKNEPGHYLETFEGCDAGDTRWYDLSWDVSTPANTSVMFRGRTAATQAGLSAAKWITLAVIPTATPPVDVDTKFKAAGIKPEKFVELEVWLSVTADDQTLVTPKVKSFGVTYSCPPKVQ
jgi:hypothetical protein